MFKIFMWFCSGSMRTLNFELNLKTHIGIPFVKCYLNFILTVSMTKYKVTVGGEELGLFVHIPKITLSCK